MIAAVFSATLVTLISAQLAVPVAAPVDEVDVHVLIVGVNQSGDPEVAPLKFADDDAARYAEVLGSGAASIRLLTLLDAESQARFPDAARQATVPNLTNFESAIGDVFASIRASQERGKQADLVFVYNGHGGVSAHGEGYVWLLDHKLQRSELFAKLIAESPARYNHIIVDACSAYFLLNRGDADVRAVRALLSSSTLEDYPNTGALLATSRDRVTHEWTQIGGGVFSHQILSALVGAADVDGNNQISYDEIGAFVEAANEGVRDRRARIDLYLRPPLAQLSRPVWYRPAQSNARLLLSSQDEGHFSVSDERGVTLVEVNKNKEQALLLSLDGQAPFVVQHDDEMWQSSPKQNETVQLAMLQRVDQQLQSRSAVASALKRGLFTVPFGISYVRGYRVRLERELEEEKSTVNVAKADLTPEKKPTDEFAPSTVLYWMGVSGLGMGGVAGLGSIGLLIYWYSGLLWLNNNEGKITAFEAEDRASAMDTACCACAALSIGSATGLIVGGSTLGLSLLSEE